MPDWDVTVHLIVAADFGERLRSLPTHEAAWVAHTPANQAVIKKIWAELPAHHSRSRAGITAFEVTAHDGPEEWLLNILDAIELHHGEHSRTPRYAVLRVVGASVTPRVKAELTDLGFTAFENSADGFLASRIVAANAA